MPCARQVLVKLEFLVYDSPTVLQAAKDSYLAPLVVKLLAGMGTCKKFPMFGEKNVEDQMFEDITPADVTRVSKDRCGSKCSKLARHSTRGGGVSIVGQKLKKIGLEEKGEEDVCLDCKMVKSKCFSGQAVRCVEPGQVELEDTYDSYQTLRAGRVPCSDTWTILELEEPRHGGDCDEGC